MINFKVPTHEDFLRDWGRLKRLMIVLIVGLVCGLVLKKVYTIGYWKGVRDFANAVKEAQISQEPDSSAPYCAYDTYVL